MKRVFSGTSQAPADQNLSRSTKTVSISFMSITGSHLYFFEPLISLAVNTVLML